MSVATRNVCNSFTREIPSTDSAVDDQGNLGQRSAIRIDPNQAHGDPVAIKSAAGRDGKSTFRVQLDNRLDCLQESPANIRQWDSA